MEAVNDLLRYHKGHKHYGLGSPLVDLHIPAGRERYAIFTDADNSSNPSVANKRRAHYGNNVSYRHSPEAITATNGKASEITPIISNSKTPWVAVANRSIDEAHVGLGSGENKIYALANTVNDGLHASYIFEELGMEFQLKCEIKVLITLLFLDFLVFQKWWKQGHWIPQERMNSFV